MTTPQPRNSRVRCSREPARSVLRPLNLLMEAQESSIKFVSKYVHGSVTSRSQSHVFRERAYAISAGYTFISAKSTCHCIKHRASKSTSTCLLHDCLRMRCFDCFEKRITKSWQSPESHICRVLTTITPCSDQALFSEARPTSILWSCRGVCIRFSTFSPCTVSGKASDKTD